MKQIRYLVAVLAAFGLLLGLATPALADGPGRGGSGSAQTFEHHHGDDDDDDDEDGEGRRGEKATICHLTGTGMFVTITVASEALTAHGGHGDIIPAPAGGCPGEVRVEVVEVKAKVEARAERDKARVKARFEAKTEGAEGRATLKVVLDGPRIVFLGEPPHVVLIPSMQAVDGLFKIVVMLDGQPQVVTLEHLQRLITVNGLPASVQFADNGTPMIVVTFDGTTTESAAAVIEGMPPLEIVAMIDGQPQVVSAEELQRLIDVNGAPASVQFANEGTPMVIVTFAHMEPAGPATVTAADTIAAGTMASTAAGGDLQTATGPEQVTPAAAGNGGLTVADAAAGSILGLSGLALTAMFGSRWVTRRR